MTASGIPMICIDDKRAFNIQYRASSIQLFLRLIVLNRSVLNFYRNLKHRKGASHCQPPPFFLSLFCTAYRNGPNNKHFTRLVTLLGTWTPIINNGFLFPFSLLYRFSLLLSSSYVVIVLLLLLLQYANWFLAIYAYGTGTLSPLFVCCTCWHRFCSCCTIEHRAQHHAYKSALRERGPCFSSLTGLIFSSTLHSNLEISSLLQAFYRTLRRVDSTHAGYLH